MDDPRNIQPRVGHFLYASCAGEDYGQIVGVGKDDNGVTTIDIEVFNIQDIISCDDEWSGNDQWSRSVLTTLELPPGTKVILRNVQWKYMSGYEGWDDEKTWVTVIDCNTPGNNCYRCTKLFSLNDHHTAF